MPTRKHVHQETFENVTPEKLFALLHTPSAICGWWGAARAIVVPERGGQWAAAWGDSEDDPDYVTVATLSEFDPPHRLTMSDYRYRSKDGPLPFEADFVTTFVVAAEPNGASLKVIQDGFPSVGEADGFYDACETGWRNTFEGIRRFLDS